MAQMVGRWRARFVVRRADGRTSLGAYSSHAVIIGKDTHWPASASPPASSGRRMRPESVSAAATRWHRRPDRNARSYWIERPRRSGTRRYLRQF